MRVCAAVVLRAPRCAVHRAWGLFTASAEFVLWWCPRSTGDPFVIVFVGVNGVGKSTSLSKVAYLMKSNGLSVRADRGALRPVACRVGSREQRLHAALQTVRRG